MSRSNNVEIRNPAEKFFQWDGKKGGFNWFDKSKGEKGERVHLPLPFEFAVLDVLATVKGFDDKTQSGYWSNEVRNVGEDQLIVRTKEGVVGKGLYKDIIDRLSGASYCQSVYIGYSENGTLRLGNLQLTGIALSSWIEYRKKHKIYSGKIIVNRMLDGRKGAVEYKIPVFEPAEIDDESDGLAKALDMVLQEYLNAYFNIKKQEHTESVAETLIQKEESPPPF